MIIYKIYTGAYNDSEGGAAVIYKKLLRGVVYEWEIIKKRRPLSGKSLRKLHGRHINGCILC